MGKKSLLFVALPMLTLFLISGGQNVKSVAQLKVKPPADLQAGLEQFPFDSFPAIERSVLSSPALPLEMRDSFATLLNDSQPSPMLAPDAGEMAFQPRRRLPPFDPADPMDLTGPLPADEDVRAAIKHAVAYLLKRQNEDGSWDVVLSGTMLSSTADQALDAVLVTSLCGLALQQHRAVDPERLDKSLTKAANYVMDRIIRGKLSTLVYYAVWRYTFGLRFLTGMYKSAEDDEEFRAQIRGVVRRMVQALLNMQLSNSKATRLESRRRERVKDDKDFARPSNLGIVLAAPTDEDYRGGALVTEVRPGTAAAKLDIKPGDRVIWLEGVRIENALDYYMLEVGFVGKQRVAFKTKRESRVQTHNINLPIAWPGFFGVDVNVTSGKYAGMVVENFQRFSPARRAGLLPGDVIYKIDGTQMTSMDNYREFVESIKPGQKIKVRYYREDKKKSMSIKCVNAPPGYLGLYITEEDKSGLDGVEVADVERPGGSDREAPPPTPAGKAGVQVEDRLMSIDGVPVLGIDHYVGILDTLPAGRTITIGLMRDGEMVHVEATLEPMVTAGDLQAEFEDPSEAAPEAIIKSMKKGGCADKAGFEVGDEITSIVGIATPTVYHLYFFLSMIPAGDPITITVRRKRKEISIEVELAEPPKEAKVREEGGWNYYPMGIAASFASAATMMALIDVTQETGLGIKPKVLKPCIESAANLLESLRVNDKRNNAEGYIYSQGTGDDIRGHMGRIMVCELALVRAWTVVRKKYRKTKDLKRMLDLWHRHRGELDKVRRYDYTHLPELYQNAAYYWLFGHYHTMMAANFLGGKEKTHTNAVILKAMMLTRREDGTWLGHSSFGPLSGTTLALLVFSELNGGFREGYDGLTDKDVAPPVEEEDAEGEEEGEAEEGNESDDWPEEED